MVDLMKALRRAREDKSAGARAGLLISTAVAAAMLHLVIARAAAPPGGPAGDKAPKYLSPTAMVAGRAGKTIYIAQATAGQIAVYDIAAGKVTATVAIGRPVSGVALSPKGARLYVTAGGAEGRLCVVDVKSGKVTARIPVGHTPMSPVVSRDGKTVYVCNRFNNAVGVVDVASGRRRATIPVLRQPVSADLSKDGSVLIVANHLPAGTSHAEHVAAEVSIVDTAAGKIASTIKLPNGSTSLRAVRVSPDGKYAALSHTPARPRMPMTDLDRGWKNTNALSIIDVPGRKLINTVLTDDVDLGAANSWALAWSADSKTLCITHAGTHEMSVIDVPLLLAKLAKAAAAGWADEVKNNLAFLIGCRRRLKLNGNGPRCMTLVGTRAFVGEYFTDSLSVLDISPEVHPNVKSIALGPENELTEARRGEMLFNDAQICFQRWESCASCHPDGRIDGHNWDLLGDGIGNPKNTKSLLWAHKTPPSFLTAHRKDARVAVRAQIRFVLFSVQPEANALAIDEYLKSLKPVPSPFLVNGKLGAAARRGEKLFKTAGCASCHSGEILTDLKRHDVGTAIGRQVGRKTMFDTPSLVEAWRTAPYLYDGHARTILDVLSKKYNPKDRHGKTSNLTRQQLADLAEYVLSL